MATQSKIRLKRSGLEPSVSKERVREVVRQVMEGRKLSNPKKYSKSTSTGKFIDENNSHTPNKSAKK